MSFNVTITTETHQGVLYIPSMALKQVGSKTGVYIKDTSGGSNQMDGLTFVPIQTGLVTGSKVEVTSGLSENEQIAIVTPAPTTANNQKSANSSGLFGSGMGGGFGAGGMGSYGGGNGSGRNRSYNGGTSGGGSTGNSSGTSGGNNGGNNRGSSGGNSSARGGNG
jgi:hypothetical protein